MVVAQTIVAIFLTYAAAGLIFAVAFVSVGVQRVDPVAAGAPLGFRLLILPGVTALWPIMALKWLRAAKRGGGS